MRLKSHLLARSPHSRGAADLLSAPVSPLYLPRQRPVCSVRVTCANPKLNPLYLQRQRPVCSVELRFCTCDAHPAHADSVSVEVRLCTLALRTCGLSET